MIEQSPLGITTAMSAERPAIPLKVAQARPDFAAVKRRVDFINGQLGPPRALAGRGSFLLRAGLRSS
jgi:hypothetical protein